jgi:hypothetical protein
MEDTNVLKLEETHIHTYSTPVTPYPYFPELVCFMFHVMLFTVFQCYPHQIIAMEQETNFIPNLPEGPLNTYRKQATFDWKKLKLVFDKPEILKLKVGTI